MVAIEEQTRYLFTVEDDVDIDVKVTVNVNNAPLSAALEQMVKGSDVVWTLKDRNILLSKKVVAKARTITGQILDPAGLPVPGVSVLIRNTRIGTVTDLDGKFSLEIPGENLGGQLEFNSLGYSVVVLPIGQRSVFNVTLTESSLELEGTVVTALGIRRDQKALSYNVQEVSSDLVTGVKDANFINSLSGKVAGVTINASSSGVGGASKVVLRGNKSISQSSNALYVIDGVPMYNFGGGGGTEFDSQGATESIADINPEDIQSISVLTGAAAAALYGSQAANGAVMITTKKGEAGRLKVTFSSNTEFLNPFRLPEFQNRYGTGSKGNRSGSAVYSWGALVPESGRTGYTPMDFFDTGHVYTNSLTLSGGTDKNQTYFSAAAVNSDGIVPNNMYDRYNFTFRNTSWFLNDKLRMDASASYIVQKDRNMINQGVYSNPIVSAYLFPRGEDFNAYRLFERYNPATKLMEQFWSSDLEGGDLRMQNPYWIANRNVRDTDKKRYMLSFSLSYDVFQWLNLSGRVRVDNANSLFAQKLYASSNTTITEGGLNGHYTEARNYETQTYA
ncbi:MAG: SusC/RagA family TonB-linked outer membrane protein, partial [Bacteroidales bacterium]|nr:SusC/RagA family TonB-linked outer membrane protein [Bacteroidales bacterium]